MSTNLVTYQLAESVATIAMDDGKANVMSLDMLTALSEALDRAEADKAIVVLTGRERMFSAGYDLAMFRSDPERIQTTIRAGAELTLKILSFRFPVVVACGGHSVAQGAFLTLASDVRIGVRGKFKIGLNEVAIGITIPHYGVETARQRLSPAWFNHSTLTGRLYSPEQALAAGFFDRLVEPDELEAAAADEARQLAQIDLAAHYATKLRVRAGAIEAMRAGIDEEFPRATSTA